MSKKRKTKEGEGVVCNGATVRIHYTAKTREGTVVDTTEEQEPLEYVHDTGSLLPGLERALVGAKKGTVLDVEVEPRDGHGVPIGAGPQRFPLEIFPDAFVPEPGAVFLGEGPDGDHLPLYIVAIENGEVLVSADHPLAGQALCFHVEVVDVVPARSESGRS